MISSVYLYNQSVVATKKIYDIIAYNVLSKKLVFQKILSYTIPQHPFCQGHIVPVLPSKGSQKLIAAVGVKDLIIVDTADATLICDKDSAADIKKIVENLKICNREEYL